MWLLKTKQNKKSQTDTKSALQDILLGDIKKNAKEQKQNINIVQKKEEIRKYTCICLVWQKQRMS